LSTVPAAAAVVEGEGEEGEVGIWNAAAGCYSR